MTLPDSRSNYEAGSTYRWTLRSPARLHFGLIEICPGQPMLYGGLGVTIDEPSTRWSGEVIFGKSRAKTPFQIEKAGPWQSRIESVLKQLFQNENEMHSIDLVNSEQVAQHLTICIDQAPEAHAGLGSGTQIACSAATVVAASRLSNFHDGCHLTASEVWQNIGRHDQRSLPVRLANATGRGSRSYVGLAGHLYGGLIIDHGISELVGSNRTIERLAIPETWFVVLARPRTTTTISGAREIDYFAKCGSPNPNRESMLHLINEEIIPAIGTRDIARFGDAIYRYGRYAGEIFQAAQGGLYRDSEATELIGTIRNWGLFATGQSSWGPTVFTIVDGRMEASDLTERLHHRFGDAIATKVTQLTNQPATVHFQAVAQLC